tara:strand:+ start:1350 stop:1571 length:222 start_codon:yes stop_codon:yes gene_type:complete
VKSIVFDAIFEDGVQTQFNSVMAFSDLMEANIHLLCVNTICNFEVTEKSKQKMERFLKAVHLGGLAPSISTTR